MQLGGFNAREVEPSQGGGGGHPVGNGFQFTVTNVEIQPNKDKTGGMFCVEKTSPVGSIVNRYNLWNASQQAVEIARKELSALCHATGVFNLNFDTNGGKELIGAKGKMDIGFQKGHEPSAEKPSGGYVEVKKVYDVNGNEPGKAPVNNGGTVQGAGAAAGATNQNAAGGWGGQPNNAQAGAAPNPNPNQGAGGWQQNAGGAAPNPGNGGAIAANPPWGSR